MTPGGFYGFCRLPMPGRADAMLYSFDKQHRYTPLDVCETHFIAALRRVATKTSSLFLSLTASSMVRADGTRRRPTVAAVGDRRGDAQEARRQNPACLTWLSCIVGNLLPSC
jgi:hypothetical protein